MAVNPEWPDALCPSVFFNHICNEKPFYSASMPCGRMRHQNIYQSIQPTVENPLIDARWQEDRGKPTDQKVSHQEYFPGAENSAKFAQQLLKCCIVILIQLKTRITESRDKEKRDNITLLVRKQRNLNDLRSKAIKSQ